MGWFKRRKKWGFEEVVDATYPKFAVRTYLEQRDLREYLRQVSENRKIASACDIGCGFGRMSQVLTEFSPKVTGFEREPEFVSEAGSLLPDIKFVNTPDLSDLGVESDYCDFAMTFTVLQHMIDPVAEKVIREIGRIVKKGGYSLLCEESDVEHVHGDLVNPLGKCTIGRSVETYQQWMAPCKLVKTSPRVIEPGYPRENVGTYMLFSHE